MIRRATEADVTAIAAIAGASFGRGWTAKDIADTIVQRQALVLVCEEENEILGYVILYFAADEGEIPSIAVKHTVRRRGVASSLLEALFREGKSLGVRKVFLEVRASNEPAKELYYRHGFLHVGQRRDFYNEPREDAYVLMTPLF